jgi:hypothetical protein
LTAYTSSDGPGARSTQMRVADVVDDADVDSRVG